MEGPAKLGIAVAVVTILLFSGIVLFDRQKNATGEGEMGQHFDQQGRDHIPVGAAHEPYNSNPPTSGSHYADPAPWGVYDKPLPDEQIIHNLEHGGVNILYTPDTLSQGQIDTLKAIQRDFPNKTVVAPRPANEHLISLTSWTYLLNLDSFDESAIREFIRRNKNHAPEFFPD